MVAPDYAGRRSALAKQIDLDTKPRRGVDAKPANEPHGNRRRSPKSA